MKIDYECIPCLIRQATESAVMVTDDKAVQQEIISKSLQAMSKLTYVETAPFLAKTTHDIVKKCSGVKDPYRELKQEFNIIAQKVCDDFELENFVATSENPIDMATRLSIAGNIIDFSLSADIKEDDIRDTIKNCIDADIAVNSVKELIEEVNNAKKILFIADNSGEIVFDKLLINQLDRDKITYGVKGGPIVNDATMEDAIEVGMTELVKVIDSGVEVQGTILELSSKNFVKEFNDADLIIAKGQANYETISEYKDKKVIYLLKAKCQSIAKVLNCKKGDLVIKIV